MEKKLREYKMWNQSHSTSRKTYNDTRKQGRPLGGASGALAPGADFEGVQKRHSPTSHTLIRSTVANEKSLKGFFF
jgi:hypothetical protein